MILYGEDRITPKKSSHGSSGVNYNSLPKRYLDILVLVMMPGQLQLRFTIFKVGPYHTNTVAGLQLAMDILRRKRNTKNRFYDNRWETVVCARKMVRII
jgi:hypothetical protein